MDGRPSEKGALSVRFPEAKCNTLSTATELIERHPSCARMHGVMPIEPTDRIERAILVVDTNIIDPDPVLILAPIYGHDRISRSIHSAVSAGVASVIMRHQRGSLKLHRNSDDLLMLENAPVCRDAPPPNHWRAVPIVSVGGTKPEGLRCWRTRAQWSALLMRTNNIVQRGAALK
jgi:hypothetical protein